MNDLGNILNFDQLLNKEKFTFKWGGEKGRRIGVHVLK